MDSRRDMIAMMTTALLAGGASPAAGTVDGSWMKTREDVQAITTPFGKCASISRAKPISYGFWNC